LWYFGVFLVYFGVFWYISPPVLVCCTKKNRSTLYLRDPHYVFIRLTTEASSDDDSGDDDGDEDGEAASFVGDLLKSAIAHRKASTASGPPDSGSQNGNGDSVGDDVEAADVEGREVEPEADVRDKPAPEVRHQTPVLKTKFFFFSSSQV
jgi:hypothetical protein